MAVKRMEKRKDAAAEVIWQEGEKRKNRMSLMVQPAKAQRERSDLRKKKRSSLRFPPMLSSSPRGKEKRGPWQARKRGGEGGGKNGTRSGKDPSTHLLHQSEKESFRSSTMPLNKS